MYNLKILVWVIVHEKQSYSENAVSVNLILVHILCRNGFILIGDLGTTSYNTAAFQAKFGGSSSVAVDCT